MFIIIRRTLVLIKDSKKKKRFLNTVYLLNTCAYNRL